MVRLFSKKDIGLWDINTTDDENEYPYWMVVSTVAHTIRKFFGGSKFRNYEQRTFEAPARFASSRRRISHTVIKDFGQNFLWIILLCPLFSCSTFLFFLWWKDHQIRKVVHPHGGWWRWFPKVSNLKFRRKST